MSLNKQITVLQIYLIATCAFGMITLVIMLLFKYRDEKDENKDQIKVNEVNDRLE